MMTLLRTNRFKSDFLDISKWSTLFLPTEIWRIRTESLSPFKAGMVRFLRTLLVSIKRFSDDNCRLHASSLTFFSLISIVPVLAMTFGIAQGFGFEKMLETLLYEKFPGQEQILSQGFAFAHNLLEKTRGGTLAGIGLAGLIWSVIKVFGHIESSFNTIWNIKKSRPIVRKFTEYLSMMIICPILFILSNSLTLFIKSELDIIIQKFSILGFVGFLFQAGLKLSPFILLWVLFTFLYMFMTNTKVHFKSALLAGVLAGTIFQFVQWGFIAFQVGVARYNAIYGSFSAIPLFLIWMQLSWLILLAGAEAAFAHQHIREYERETDTTKISRATRDKLALFVTYFLAKKFQGGETPLTIDDLSSQTGISIHLLCHILEDLVSGGVISETREDEGGAFVYQPARDICQFTIQFVLDAINHHGTNDLPILETPELKSISQCLDQIGHLVQKSESNRLLIEI